MGTRGGAEDPDRSMLTTLIATAIVLGVLIFVHELGHFMTAKAVGIEVERFSIGFGPRIIGFRRGETEYVISLLPLGGYVKMAGMEEMESIEGGSSGEAEPAVVQDGAGQGRGSRDFDSKSIPARALVISAGVLMNLVFALVIFTLSGFIWGIPIEPEARLPAAASAILPPGTTALGEVPEGTKVIAVDDKPISDWGDLRNALISAAPGPLTIHFEEGAPVTIEVPANDTLKFNLIQALEPGQSPVVGEVLGDGPAAAAGIMSGDRIESIDGQEVGSWPQLVAMIESRPGEAVDIGLVRDGEYQTVRIVPRAETALGPDGGERVVGRIGIGQSPHSVPRERPTLASGIVHGAERTWGAATMITKVLGDLVTGKVSARSLGGPILVGQLSGQVARIGLEAFLSFMALFSVNLAILNLLPIPVLDGGHLVLLGVEAVRGGRKVPVEVRERLMQVGLVIILGIMFWAVGNDILRLFGL